MKTAPSIVWLADLDGESDLYGVHSKYLAKLTQAKFPLTPGFVITPTAYAHFLQINGLEHKIKNILKTIAIDRPDSLMQGEHQIKQLFNRTKLPDDFIGELASFYERLGEDILLEVFETGKQGKKHTTKSVSSIDGLLKEIRNSWVEIFSGAALWRRHFQNDDHFKNGAEIIIRKNIQAKHKGIVITVDPETHAKDKLFIKIETPHEGDKYLLSKKHLAIIDRQLSHKNKENKLSLDEILKVANMAKRLEEHLYFPQEISWIFDENKLYITNIKPLTDLASQKTERKKKLPILRGKGVIPIIGTGSIIFHTSVSLQKINSSDILVVSEIKTNQLQKLKKIRGVVIEKYPHHAEVAFFRQYGIPVISNVRNATKRFRNGQVITIHGGKGEIYFGGFL